VEIERASGEIDAGRRVLHEGEILCRAPDVPGKRRACAVEEGGQAAIEEVDRLALELSLPVLVALEDGPRAGAERAVVEEGDLRVEEELAAELLGRRRGHGLLLLHPKPPPTRGPVKRAASPVTPMSRLYDGSLAIHCGRSVPARCRGRFRPPVPVAWL
jgi:hypothetical protein